MKRGLILAGGAARGAFQAGVVSALDRAGVVFDAIVGTSVGAANGAALVHGYGADLPRIWLESMAEMRWLDPWLLLRGRSPFRISEAMRSVVARYGDVERMRAHPTELLVSTTEWATGRNVLFSSKDDASGWTAEERIDHFLASLTIPVLCTERIVIRGKRYCDGGLSDNFPLEALVERGCEEVLVVDPSPSATEAILARVGRPLAPHLRRLPFAAAKLAAAWITTGQAGAPERHERLRLRVVAPEGGAGFSGLDFRNLDAIRDALARGEEVGARLAAEMLESAEAVRAA
jgi:predicted acylesterase/phospholipase RssA